MESANRICDSSGRRDIEPIYVYLTRLQNYDTAKDETRREEAGFEYLLPVMSEGQEQQAKETGALARSREIKEHPWFTVAAILTLDSLKICIGLRVSVPIPKGDGFHTLQTACL
jgi:hypothetical protein